MFKKLTIVFACTLAATIAMTGCSKKADDKKADAQKPAAAPAAAPAAVVDVHATQEAAARAFIKAVIFDQDIETVWKLIAPVSKEEGIKALGSEAKAKEILAKKYWGRATPERIAETKKQLETQEGMDAMLKKVLPRFEQIDGKWYMTKI